jgi:EAL and modified HD-GYP domain-containing signal transduction protein
MILGLKKLFRWAALLLTTSRAGGTPPAVGQTAVVRGRLMELLTAELLSPEECDNAFVVGVFSLLDVMLGQPILELTRACESGDDEGFARAANALQLSNHQVNWAHLQALAWADNLTADDPTA